MKLLLFIAMTFVFAGCGGGAKKDAGDSAAASVFRQKPGPGTGQSCYVGDPEGAHSCTQITSSDTTSTKYIKRYCDNQGGTQDAGTCKTEGMIGSCFGIPGITDVRIRYYGMSWADAKLACDKNGGTLTRMYQNLVNDEDEQIF